MYQQKAPLGPRIGAFFLDAIIIGIPYWILLSIDIYLAMFFTLFGNLLYFGITEGSSMHGSFGKAICGLEVVDNNGNYLTTGKAFIRSLGRLLSSYICGIGFFIGMVDQEGKTLHDKMAGSMVVKKGTAQAPASYRSEPSPQPQPRPAPAPANLGQPFASCIEGPFIGQKIILPVGGLVMGCNPASCNLVFPAGWSNEGISRVHCRLSYNPQTRQFILEDKGSSFGTFLWSGSRVSPNQAAALRPGDMFYLASKRVVFQVGV